MLLGIDPLLSGELLFRLDALGHGDTVVVVDGNYPAASSQRPVIHVGPVPLPELIRAILTVMPVETESASPVVYMEGPGTVLTDSQELAQRELRRAGYDGVAMEPRSRFAFYELARSASFVIQSSDSTAYSCFVLERGVVSALHDGA